MRTAVFEVIEPLAFEHFAVGLLDDPEPIPLVFHEPALLARPIAPAERADPVPHVGVHLTLIPPFGRRPLEDTLPVHFVVFLIPFVLSLAGPDVFTSAVFFAHLESAVVYISIGEPFFAVAVLFVLLELAFITVPRVFPDHGARAGPEPIFELALVLRPVLLYEFALAVLVAHLPLPGVHMSIRVLVHPLAVVFAVEHETFLFRAIHVHHFAFGRFFLPIRQGWIVYVI